MSLRTEGKNMTAMEKAAWTELLVAASTIAIVTVLFPWLGNGASGAFGLLGFIVCGLWFVRGRGKTVVIDERDRDIERRSTRRGIEAAWMVLFLALIAIVLWSSYANEGVVSTWMLNWLIWLQFAICYGVKGFVAVLAYRRQGCAT
jgi:uncharacterized membrane protein